MSSVLGISDNELMLLVSIINPSKKEDRTTVSAFLRGQWGENCQIALLVEVMIELHMIAVAVYRRSSRLMVALDC